MGIHSFSSRACIDSLLLLALAGCAGSEAWRKPPDGRDLLTDLADDGSLVRGLSHPDPSVRRLSARALGRLPASHNAGQLLSAAQTEADAATLAEICFTLGQWKASQGEDLLLRMIEHDRPTVRAAAILALGKLGSDAHTQQAVIALADRAPEVRQAAALALFRMDGQRYDHPRLASEDQLALRDEALARAALKDTDEGVRWRAAYALANIRTRSGLPTILGRCARDEHTPLSRVFALRGLGRLTTAGPSGALAEARRRLLDEDARVVLEAARIVAQDGTFTETLRLAADPSSNVRMIALDQLRLRALSDRDTPFTSPGEGSWLGALLTTCDELLENDPSEAVRREVRALLIAVAATEASESDLTVDISWEGAHRSEDPAVHLQAVAHRARQALLDSSEARDRERLARLLSDDELHDRDLLDQLLDDPVPAVVAAALGTLESTDVATLFHDRKRLETALSHMDPAIRGTAAEIVGPLVRDGNAPPWLVSAVAASLDEVQELESPENLEMEEARENLARALGLPQLNPIPPAEVMHAPLLDRLLEERAQARQDASPEVVIHTTRGEIRLVLNRLAAPRTVENFLELARDGFYDGLDFHRVVPNFVVQGLDPRHDGWGVGGRRVPDEFGPDAYLAGSVGMPHAGSPQSGGCQIFITHVPTPHLDGAYTHFGRVVVGMDVIAALEIGDVIRSVQRVPLPGQDVDPSDTKGPSTNWIKGS